MLDLVIAVALGGDAACDIAVLRAQPGVLGSVASDPTVSRLVGRLAQDAERALGMITGVRAAGAGMGSSALWRCSHLSPGRWEQINEEYLGAQNIPCGCHSYGCMPCRMITLC